MIDDAIKLSNFVEVKFGFEFDDRPARDSTFLVKNVRNGDAIIFPQNSRGRQAVYWLKGLQHPKFPDPMLLRAYPGEELEAIEERPGDVFLCLNFAQPLPLLIWHLERMYSMYYKGLPPYGEWGQEQRTGERIACLNTPGGVLPKEKEARAAGLWLWDRVQELGARRGAIAQAQSEFNDAGYVEALDLNDDNLGRYYRKTNESIEAAEVLSFRNSGKGTKKSK
ncbi:hypothetical protein JCM15519_04680 [Fundidesulfovibrio butyratiphilus]